MTNLKKIALPRASSATLLICALRRHAQEYPNKIAIRTSLMTLSYLELLQQVEQLADQLCELDISRLAILEDNSPAWVIADLAGQMVGATVVPVPLFFSQEQQQHLVNQSGVQVVLSSQPSLLRSIASEEFADVLMYPVSLGFSFYIMKLSEYLTPSISVSMPVSVASSKRTPSKITYTSGSTGQPKGVCLAPSVIDETLRALSEAVEQPDGMIHLCTLPLATLLENLAGVYLPLLKGGTIILKTQVELGIGGSSGLDVQKWAEALAESRTESLILTPELLKALIFLMTHHGLVLKSLRFVAVGGGKVSPELLEKAIALGLPVYEGYGLSECGSVVALNRPSASKAGTVGKPLAHVDVSIAEDGEVMVSGNAYSGYLGQTQPKKAQSDKAQQSVATGDLGYFDGEGFLVINGRKKNLIISSFGRNISPEWVEAKLSANPAIGQVIVVGDGQPYNVAIITAAMQNITSQQIDDVVRLINHSLPDYAQIKYVILSVQPFTPVNGLLTTNGRLKREAIVDTYHDDLFQHYLPEYPLTHKGLLHIEST